MSSSSFAFYPSTSFFCSEHVANRAVSTTVIWRSLGDALAYFDVPRWEVRRMGEIDPEDAVMEEHHSSEYRISLRGC